MQHNGFEFYIDGKNEWRWRYWSQGRITSDSGEGYKNRSDCVAASRRFGYTGN